MSLLTPNQEQRLLDQTEEVLAENAGKYLSEIGDHYQLNIQQVEVLGGVGGANFLIKSKDNPTLVLKIPAYDWIVPLSDYFYNRVSGIAPVPKIIMVDTDKTVIPYEFMAMEFVEGSDWSELTSEERKEAGIIAAQQLQQIHTIKVEDFTGIAPFNEWSFDSWKNRLSHYANLTVDDHPFTTHEIEFINNLLKDKRLFTEDAHLLHGDFKGENFIWGRKENHLRINAVIDPNTFFGDTLMDYGITLSHHIKDEFEEGFKSGIGYDGLDREERNRVDAYNSLYLFWLIQNRISKGQNFDKELERFRGIVSSSF